MFVFDLHRELLVGISKMESCKKLTGMTIKQLKRRNRDKVKGKIYKFKYQTHTYTCGFDFKKKKKSAKEECLLYIKLKSFV
jgi:hypothetical protein